MAYDDGVAQRIREALAHRDDVVEKKMFGGLAFMVRGHMCCGVNGDRLMARVGPQQYDACLEQPHATPMDFTGKPLRGFIYVVSSGFAEDADLAIWVGRCEQFVGSLPAK